MSTPTQVRRPWRATARTIFAGLVAFAALLPFIVEASKLDPQVYPWLGGLLATAGAITRIMAIPQVEEFLRRFFPWLAADPDSIRGEDGRVDGGLVLVIALGVFLAWVAIQLIELLVAR